MGMGHWGLGIGNNYFVGWVEERNPTMRWFLLISGEIETPYDDIALSTIMMLGYDAISLIA